VIYVEYHDGPERTDAGRIEWPPGWYAICDECGWSAGSCLTDAEAIDHANQHAVDMGEATPQQLAAEQEQSSRPDAREATASGAPSERPAMQGELCTCGRPAMVVYLGGGFGPTGYCGIPDGGDRSGPCPFCDGPRHADWEGRCPAYRLRLDQP
jgi:hypothetical protein